MSIQLRIGEGAYSLAEGDDDFAILDGGPGGLLSSTRPVDEAGLETAIERAEDWLMPRAARLRDGVLEVSDATGTLRSGMHDVLSVTSLAWSTDDVESFFLQLVDMATGRVPAAKLAGRQHFVAHVLLLRELAHHGALSRIRLA
ncbi:hypothetical protein WG902_07120 [Ramlibacter sp. PS3R-8]|uniref:hypothetical protein n=1 Tax=Ramlibacter sp. PS3R-8 TaxID=3133437 RepID=UPI0030B0343B